MSHFKLLFCFLNIFTPDYEKNCVNNHLKSQWNYKAIFVCQICDEHALPYLMKCDSLAYHVPNLTACTREKVTGKKLFSCTNCKDIIAKSS